MNLEEDFLKNSHNRNIITIGSINSGKSHMALSYLFYALTNNLYEQYHLILPQYKTEENGSYNFIKQFKEKCFIYNTYDDLIVEHVDDLRYKENIFLLIDDSTGKLSFAQEPLIRLFSTCRHGKGCTTWCITHASKIAKKTLRSLTTYTFITNILSEKVLEDIYEDFLSLYYIKKGKKYQDFLADYNNMIDTQQYPQMLIARNTNGKIEVDFNCNTWNITKSKRTVEKKPQVIKQEVKVHKNTLPYFKFGF